MKIKRCKIQNVRALKDLEINFSTDSRKPLTVIRAANGFGKTTLLNALRWGLFGEKGLESSNYHFMPDDHERNKSVATVEIDFEHSDRVGPKDYRIIRTREERRGSDRKVSVGNSLLYLYRMHDTGEDDLDNPDAKLAPMLPNELRDVFFTDGDRALTFIEGGARQQRDNV